MKKILLSTVALVAFGAFSTSAMEQTLAKPAAQPAKKVVEVEVAENKAETSIKLEVGGYADWYLTYAKNRKNALVDYGYPVITAPAPMTDPTIAPIGKYNTFDVMGYAEVHFKGTAELKNGLTVGTVVELKAGTDPSTAHTTIDQSYVTVEGNFGRIIAGNVTNVGEQMAVTSPTVSTLGIQESDFERLVLRPVDVRGLDATYSTFDNISTKVSYITPTVGGLTFGISLMPSNNPDGQDDNVLLYDPVVSFRYASIASVKFEKELGGTNLTWGATYGFYKPDVQGFSPASSHANRKMHDVATGINLGFGNLTVGGSYRRVIANKASIFADEAGYAFDIGAMYEVGAYEFSINYLTSSTRNPKGDNAFGTALSNFIGEKNDTHSLLAVSAKYKMAPGVSFFTDVGYLTYTNREEKAVTPKAARVAENRGLAIAAGMNLTF